MAGNQQQKPQMIIQEGGGKKAKRKLPPVLRFLLYGTFSFSSISAVCYSSGLWTHKGNITDDIISYGVGIGSPFAILFLYLAILWLESD